VPDAALEKSISSRSKRICVLWGVTLASLTFGCAQRLPPLRVWALTNRPRGPYGLTLVEPVPETPRKLHVYSFRRPDLSKERMKALAVRVFGMKNPSCFGLPRMTGYRLSEDRDDMWVHLLKGRFEFSTRNPRDCGAKMAPKKFTFDHASNTAVQFLKRAKLGERGISHVRETAIGSRGTLATWPEKDLVSRTVRFTGEVDGCRIDGECMYIAVTVNSDGKIEALKKAWFRVGPEKRAYPARTVREAFEALNAGEGTRLRPGYEGGRCRFERIEYLADDPYQKRLQPVYRFTIEKGTRTGWAQVPALRPRCYLARRVMLEVEEFTPVSPEDQRLLEKLKRPPPSPPSPTVLRYDPKRETKK